MFHQNKLPHRLASSAVARGARPGFIHKSLLLAAGLVAICVAPLGRWVHDASREFQAATQIQRLGGEIFLARRLDEAIQGRAPRDLGATDWSGRLKQHVSGVNLGNSLATIHNDNLVLLRPLIHLRWLRLGNQPITDTGLGHLAGLHGLTRLDLHNAQVTDAGLESLAGLAQIEWLNLRKTLITDASLSLLKDFRQLRWLNLNGTRMTRQGVEQLRIALPRAVIVHAPSNPL
jgi:hypothetical protein